jgi:hypothetical protein
VTTIRAALATLLALLRDCGGLEAWLGGRLLRQGWLACAARVAA